MVVFKYVRPMLNLTCSGALNHHKARSFAVVFSCFSYPMAIAYRWQAQKSRLTSKTVFSDKINTKRINYIDRVFLHPPLLLGSQFFFL